MQPKLITTIGTLHHNDHGEYEIYYFDEHGREKMELCFNEYQARLFINNFDIMKKTNNIPEAFEEILEIDLKNEIFGTPNKKKKLLIIGHARHGKDTVAEFLNEIYGYTFKSSSEAASEIFLYDALKEKYNYASPEDCFKDRMNCRAEWYNLISEYNREDKARLAKEIMKTSDIYVGMRGGDEIDECLRQNVFDMIVGVFNPFKPLESESSFTINLFEKADVVICNNGTLNQLRDRLHLLNLSK
jgi:hypothetical protein